MTIDSSTETKALRTSPPKGMRDLLPAEVELRDWAIGIIIDTYRSFGFSRIETPCIESIELLRKGDGGENLAMIFEILKRGEKLDQALKEPQNPGDNSGRKADLSDLGLRFDLTVPLARYYANNMNDLPNPLKSIQIGPVWRAERPQQGRYRQFTQCDIDIIGSKSIIAEIELISATTTALLRLGFKGFTVRLNDRRLLERFATGCGFETSSLDAVYIALDKLDKIGSSGVRAELSKISDNQEAIDNLFNRLESLSAISKEHDSENSTSSALFDKYLEALALPEAETAPELLNLKELLETLLSLSDETYNVIFDPTLVRGMGYYTGPIFEVSAPGSRSSIAGGGRYDHMLEKFLDREIPACGFSIGFERIITLLQENTSAQEILDDKLALIYDPKRDEPGSTAKAMHAARKDFATVSLMPKKKDLKKQIDQLKSLGFSRFCIFKGDPEQLEIKTLD